MKAKFVKDFINPLNESVDWQRGNDDPEFEDPFYDESTNEFPNEQDDDYEESEPMYPASDEKLAELDELEQQIPSLKKTLLHYDDYAGKPIEKLFTKEQLEAATVLTVEQTHSTLFLNQGKGNFTAKELPVMAQITPMFGIEVMDINGDGKNDLFLGGNFYGLKPQTGRLDAGYGTSLINNGKGDFTYVEVKETGLFINGETRDMAIVKTAKGKTTLIVSMNNEKLYLFEKNK